MEHNTFFRGGWGGLGKYKIKEQTSKSNKIRNSANKSLLLLPSTKKKPNQIVFVHNWSEDNIITRTEKKVRELSIYPNFNSEKNKLKKRRKIREKQTNNRIRLKLGVLGSHGKK